MIFNRGICQTCKNRPVAVNCIKNGTRYYRKVCDVCYRAGSNAKQPVPNWAKAGYKKKPKCDRCGFVAKDQKQLQVFYVDGNPKNTDWNNLRTICANCAIEVSNPKFKWKPTDLIADF